MPYPHAIRLRGPWQFEPLCRYVENQAGEVVQSRAELPAVGRVTVPGDWGAYLTGDFRGRVRYRRAFHAPANLDPHERLWLVVEGVDARGTASVNGVVLGEIPGYAVERSFDITALVAPNNHLTLDVDVPLEASSADCVLRPGREGLAGGLIREVRLEVRAPWFIEGLAIWSDARSDTFIATGTVAGDASAKLAVVVSGCQRELAYVEVQAGHAFEIEFQAAGFAAWSCDQPKAEALEVKLLGPSASVWQKQLETAVRKATAEEGRRVIAEILADHAYDEFDRAGIAIVQQVLPAWAGHVCPRLVHHPSIVAWTAPAGTASPSGSLFGRPWIQGGGQTAYGSSDTPWRR
jgi:beta-galactosidase/beta-glucuronidase